jgi:hypothetical protein
MATAARVAELKGIYAEGLAANVGAANPYYGQRVNAAMWRAGYRRMLDEKMANSPARQAYLRARAAQKPGASRPTGTCRW